jgi:glycosyltransferase involved in cell wall biosynthesis
VITGNSLPFVTFVIPARNEESNIESCLRGISDQDYPKDLYEIIVADGHSGDRTAEIARSLGAIVINNDKAIQSAGRNIGAANAKGKLVAFIDADIVLEKEWLKKAVTQFRDPGVAAVGNFPEIAAGSNWIEKAWFFHVKNKYAEKTPISADWLASANIIFDKAIFDRIGGFDESMRYGEDVDISFRALRYGYEMKLVPELESTHLQYETSLGGFIKRQLAGGHMILRLIENHGMKKNRRTAFFLGYYLFWIIMLIIGLFINLKISALALIFIILLAALLSAERCRNARSYKYFLPLAFLLFLSGMLRAAALVLPDKK